MQKEGEEDAFNGGKNQSNPNPGNVPLSFPCRHEEVPFQHTLGAQFGAIPRGGYAGN